MANKLTKMYHNNPIKLWKNNKITEVECRQGFSKLQKWSLKSNKVLSCSE